LPQVWCEPFADASQLPTLLSSELLGARKPVAIGSHLDTQPTGGRGSG
jgi:acetylornithine deacetylase/succinyl-diaminopimelate desuccinylase-like protein